MSFLEADPEKYYYFTSVLLKKRSQENPAGKWDESGEQRKELSKEVVYSGV